MTGVKKRVMANVGEVVGITWMDAKGEMTVREYTAPSAATREALRKSEGEKMMQCIYCGGTEATMDCPASGFSCVMQPSGPRR